MDDRTGGSDEPQRHDKGARTVVGPGAQVGAGATLVDCVLGAGARVTEGLRLEGVKVPADSEPPAG